MQAHLALSQLPLLLQSTAKAWELSHPLFRPDFNRSVKAISVISHRYAPDQPDLGNSSVKLPQVILDCVKYTIKANHHKDHVLFADG